MPRARRAYPITSRCRRHHDSAWGVRRTSRPAPGQRVGVSLELMSAGLGRDADDQPTVAEKRHGGSRDRGDQDPPGSAAGRAERSSPFPNTATGTAKAIQRLRVLKSTGIVGGSIGGYRQSLLEACCDAGLWTARVCPCQARSFARATGEVPGPMPWMPLAGTDGAALCRSPSVPARHGHHGSVRCATDCVEGLRWS